ncbi:MAG: hypothetical protein ABIL09_27755 [Gemmatimonadota bacterium]
MREQIRALKSDIEAELAGIGRIYGSLRDAPSAPREPDAVIVTGYHLHNLYNAFESMFRLVAAAFENDVPDTGRWHRLLLERMGRQIEGVRPPLLSPAAVQALDELRRFRHLFRHLYQAKLEPAGVVKALEQARSLERLYLDEVKAFLSFLDGLTEAQ